MRSSIGSVAFYKRLILTVLTLLFLGLITVAVFFYVQFMRMSDQLVLANNPTVEKMSAADAEPHQTPDLQPYQSAYPNLYVDPVKEVHPIAEGDKVVYLTFDDGPSSLTPKVLDVLDKYNIKATFFVIGCEDEFSKSIYKEIVARGHTLAIHTYSHQYKEIYDSVDSYLTDFNKLFELIYETTGVEPEIFRFPGGSINSYNRDIYQQIIAEMLRRGFVYYDWSVSSCDSARNATKETIINSIVSNVKKLDSAVVLCHDSSSKNSTKEALSTVIESLQRAGYRFDKLDGSVPPVCFAYSY